MTQKRRRVWRYQGYPGNAVVKNLLANAGDAIDVSLIPGSERFPGVGNGNLCQYTCLGNPMDKVRWATVHGVTKRQTWLSNWACTQGGDNLENREAECSQTGTISGRCFRAKRRNLDFSKLVITICPWTFPGKNSILQGIFLTQGSNPSLLHWQVDSLPLCHLGTPI